MPDRNQAHRVSHSNSMVSGSASGILVAVVTQPLDVARTMIQKDPKEIRNRSTWGSLTEVARSNGLGALWRGNVPSILRVGGGAGVYFAILNKFTMILSPSSSGSISDAKLGSLATFFVGFSARATVSIVLLPLTVIKTRLEAGDRRYGGFMQTMRGIVLQESPSVLFRGMLPTVLRDAPFSGLYLIFYARIKDLLVPHRSSSSSTSSGGGGGSSSSSSGAIGLGLLSTPMLNFIAGCSAGALATALTNPADVVRTRMQLDGGAAAAAAAAAAIGSGGGGAGGAGGAVPAPAAKLSSLQVARCIVVKEGWGTLLTRGLGPRVVKRSLQAALTWTFYEELVRVVRRWGY